MNEEVVTTKMCSRHTERMTKKIDELGEKLNQTRIEIAGLPEELMKRMEAKFVTKDAFRPVQKLAYSGAGLILGAVLVGLLALVVK